MKKTLLALAVIFSGTAFGQDLPMPSPTATLQQRVGLTDFTVVYSRPGVKDREIFGELVPYNKMWRTGANANTTIEFSTDIMFSGKSVPAGKYSLITIPGESEWTIILNKKTDMWGTGGYDEAQDVARIKIESGETDMTETLTIDFSNILSETADLTLSWAETEVKVPMRVEVKETAMANIDKAIADADADTKWRVYRNAANYFYNNKMEMGKALDYANKSIAANDESWYSYWLKAEIQAEMKNYKEAMSSAKKAKEIGMRDAKTNGSEFNYAEMIDTNVAKWKSMKS